jgi:hypothetical protein
LKKLASRLFPNVTYRRRSSESTVFEHINICLGEAVSSYVCLFHDDDLMHENFVNHVREAINQHKFAVCFGTNATLETHGVLESKNSFQTAGNYTIINSPQQLAIRYFSRFQSGIAPFPSYVYSSSIVKEINFPVNNGKYADVIWLLQILKRGSAVWINQPLMTYRIHSQNDGQLESSRDRLRLLRFLKSNTQLSNKQIIDDYRCGFIYKPLLRKSGFDQYSTRQKIARKYTRAQGINRFFRLTTWQYLLSHIKRKWIK